jgi:hypothetical protein
MMKQARCTWGKHDAQGASTVTRNQASWVVGTNCIAGESSRERAPQLHSNPQPPKPPLQRPMACETRSRSARYLRL